jgi:hypothetical protein
MTAAFLALFAVTAAMPRTAAANAGKHRHAIQHDPRSRAQERARELAPAPR